MKILSSTLFLFFICNLIISQNLIVGKWQCTAFQPLNSEPYSQELIDYFLGKDNYRTFYSNNQYLLSERNKLYFGNWELSEVNNKLVITISDGGDIRSFKIVKLTNDTLILLNWKKATLLFSKIEENVLDTLIQPQIINSSVVATSKQICKKWILKDIKLENSFTKEEKLANTIFSNAFKSSWYSFSKDGTALSYFGELLKLNWYFTNENKSIAIVDENGDGSLWNIKSISDSELVIQKPLANTQLFFIPDSQ
jgi:hypothetical protein